MISTDDRDQQQPLQIACIDDDVVFRLGLAAALEPFSDLELMGQLTVAEALTSSPASLFRADRWPDVVLLAPGGLAGLEVGRILRQADPALAVLLLDGDSAPDWLGVGQALGLTGFCPKGLPLTELVALLRRAAAGDRLWSSLALPVRSASSGNWLRRQQESALTTIAASLRELERTPADQKRMSTWDWWFWQGRRRELRAANWLVRQLLPAAEVDPPSSVPTSTAAVVPVPTPPVAIAGSPSLTQAVIVAARQRLQTGTTNGTPIPLAFDILQAQPRQELLYAAIAEFETLLAELRFLQTPLERLPDERPQRLRQLWQQTLLRFFGKYYTPDSPADLLDRVVSEVTATQTALLDRIPLVPDLLAYCLYEEPLTIENVPYRAQSPEAQERASVLLENLTVAIADATMQALLNAFSDAPSFRSGRFLLQRYLATRELDRFRNGLSFRYIQNELFAEPKAIYEDRYPLWVSREGSLRRISIYAPRRLERSQLRGTRAWVRLALEFFDAISPRLQALVSWLGAGVVYLLREVIGRGLGLIGSGLIQGVSSALKETRYGKSTDRQD